MKEKVIYWYESGDGYSDIEEYLYPDHELELGEVYFLGNTHDSTKDACFVNLIIDEKDNDYGSKIIILHKIWEGSKIKVTSWKKTTFKT